MRQKLFLLFTVGFLITAPALADVAPVPVNDTSGFGSVPPNPFVTDSDTVSPPASPFILTLDVDVFYASGVYTYVYKITHTATVLNSIQILNNLYDPTALDWGWVVDINHPAGSNPFASINVSASPFGTTTIMFDGGESSGMLTFYLQSTLPPTETKTEMVFGVGSPGPAEGQSLLLTTLGPTDQGSAATFGVPEPSSLLLLTFGLLSGGVLRFSTRRNRR